MTKFYKTLICILGIGALLTGCQKAEQQVEDIEDILADVDQALDKI